MHLSIIFQCSSFIKLDIDSNFPIIIEVPIKTRRQDSDCINPHCVLTFFSATNQNSVRHKEQNSEEYNRINALSVFIQKTEQKIQVKISSENVKSKEKLIPLPATNNIKKSRANRSITKGTAQFNVFHKNENKGYSKRYNYINAYTKIRLAEINRQKLSKSLQNFKGHSHQIKNNLDSLDTRLNIKSDGISQLVNIQYKIEPKQYKDEIQGTKAKRDIIAENITKQGKKLHASPLKRIPATNNFVYEFNPLANTKPSSSLTSCTVSCSTNNYNQKLPCVRKDFIKQKSFAVLPKLNPHVNFLTNDSNIANFTEDTCLPILNKENPTRMLCEQLDDKCKQTSQEVRDIDREVENVKLNWHALQAEKDWTKGKDCSINARTRKLYEVLEKVTHEIDKVQKTYTYPEANHYLHRSMNNVFKADNKLNLVEKDGEVAKNIIFPKRKAKIKSGTSILGDVDVNIIYKDKQQRYFKKMSSQYKKKRAMHTNTPAYNTDNNMYAVKSAFRSDDRCTNSKRYIEEYLQKYNKNIHEVYNTAEEKAEQEVQDLQTSTRDIADILADLNIKSYGLYENFEKCEDDTHDMEDCASEKNKQYHHSNIITDTTQVTSMNIVNNKKTHNDMFTENSVVRSDVRPMKIVDVKSCGTSSQLDVAGCEDNAFIKLGLDVLNKNFSRDKLSQMLQSEYLRKDLSL